MTTIAYRKGVMAADSRATYEDDRITKVDKLFRKGKAIIGLAGESEPGLVFLDWYGTGKEPPSCLIDGDADFTALVLTRKGLFEYGKYCRPERVLDDFHAIGSGAKGAMCAMHAGADAKRAVQIVAKVDAGTGGPITTMTLD